MLIILDLDDTLIDTSGYYLPLKLRQALDAMINSGLETGDKKEEQLFQALLQIDTSSPNGRETIKSFLTQYSAGNNSRLFEVGEEAYYGPCADEFKIPLLDHTNEVISYLKQNGHILVLVTYGMKSEQHKKILTSGIRKELFDQIIIVDFTEGYDKGHVYKKLLMEYGLSEKEIVVCGDKYSSDILPAKKLGLKTVHFRHGRGKNHRYNPNEVDYSIENIIKLKEIVEN